MYHAHCSILSLSLFNSTHPPVLFALLLVFSSSRFLEGYQTFHLTFLCCCPRCVKLQSFIQTQSDIRLERIASVRRRRLAQFSSVQFSSRWYLGARKSPYVLHPISQKSPNVAFETVPMFV